MADGTKIEWADATANYVNGCSVVSPGCTNCYAMRLAGTRMKNHPTRTGLTTHSKSGPVWNGQVRENPAVLEQVLRWKKPRAIFWNAHGDLFHENVPDEWIDRQFAVMALTPQHRHMVLTKRSGRMRVYLANPERRFLIAHAIVTLGIDRRLGDVERASWNLTRRDGALQNRWPLPNVWLGVSVEDQPRADERIPALLATPAAVRFISAEPLLGPVDLEAAWHGESALDSECWGDCAWCEKGFPALHNCRRGKPSHYEGRETSGLDWVIVGGESGPGSRPMHPDWARSLRDQCAAGGVAFHFKQWGDWAPVCEMSEEAIGRCYEPAPDTTPEATRRCVVRQAVLHRDGTRFDGEAMFRRPAFEQGQGAMTMFAINKSRAGRLLNGVTHDGVPA